MIHSSLEREGIIVCGDGVAAPCRQWRDGIVRVVGILRQTLPRRRVHCDLGWWWQDVYFVTTASGRERALVIVVILVRTNDELAHELSAKAVKVGAVKLGVRLVLEELLCMGVSYANNGVEDVRLAYRVG